MKPNATFSGLSLAAEVVHAEQSNSSQDVARIVGRQGLGVKDIPNKRRTVCNLDIRKASCGVPTAIGYDLDEGRREVGREELGSEKCGG